MPLYTFKCPSCYTIEDVNQSMDSPSPKCKKCIDASVGIYAPKMERVWKETGKPQFKGDGFYETDYKDKK